MDDVRVPQELVQLPPGRRLPDASALIDASRGRLSSIRTERDGVYRPGVARQGAQQFALDAVPELDRPIVARRRQQAAVPATRDARNGVLMFAQHKELLAGGAVPEP